MRLRWCVVHACALCTRRAQGAKKKRICNFKRYPTSIACLAFSPGGEHLAVAASYTYEHGEQPGTPADAIYLHAVSDAMVRPKGV